MRTFEELYTWVFSISIEEVFQSSWGVMMARFFSQESFGRFPVMSLRELWSVMGVRVTLEPGVKGTRQLAEILALFDIGIVPNGHWPFKRLAINIFDDIIFYPMTNRVDDEDDYDTDFYEYETFFYCELKSLLDPYFKKLSLSVIEELLDETLGNPQDFMANYQDWMHDLDGSQLLRARSYWLWLWRSKRVRDECYELGLCNAHTNYDVDHYVSLRTIDGWWAHYDGDYLDNEVSANDDYLTAGTELLLQKDVPLTDSMFRREFIYCSDELDFLQKEQEKQEQEERNLKRDEPSVVVLNSSLIEEQRKSSEHVNELLQAFFEEGVDFFGVQKGLEGIFNGRKLLIQQELSPGMLDLLGKLIQKEEWPLRQAEALAMECGVEADWAWKKLNEWSVLRRACPIIELEDDLYVDVLLASELYDEFSNW